MYKIELSDRRNIALNQKIKELPCCQGEDCVTVLSPARKLTVLEADLLPKGEIVIGGAQPKEVLDALSKNGVTYKNLMDDEEFVLKNADLTAEGALCLLIENTEKSVFNSNILITGCGRVAKALAAVLKKLDLNVSICIFNKGGLSDAAAHASQIYVGDEILPELSKFDAVINTIPAPVFTAEYLEKLSPSAAIIELASVPCLDVQGVKDYPFKYVRGGGLPAKYCPFDAAEAMLKCILRLNLSRL